MADNGFKIQSFMLKESLTSISRTKV